MAEIRIEKRRGMPVWAMLLGLILLLLLVWGVMALRSDNQVVRPEVAVRAGVPSQQQPLFVFAVTETAFVPAPTMAYA